MMIMLSQLSPTIHYWAGSFPGQIGYLLGPSRLTKDKARPWIPIACDNDAFTAWANHTPWNESAYFKMLDKIAVMGVKPLWVLVPDVVADKDATLQNWHKYAGKVASYGWPLAFACQDGMTPEDVPAEAHTAFIGGTTKWKWKHAKLFCDTFRNVHIGRVGTMDRVWLAHDYGAKSIDSTSFFRNGENYLWHLNNYFLRIRPYTLFNNEPTT